MKELKDYLHLYLGCEIDISGQREILDSVAKSGQIETLFRGHLRNYRDLSDEDIAPILRPLSDMTEEEMEELFFIGDALIKEVTPNAVIKFYPNEVKRNIKRGTGVAYTVLKSENGEHFMSGTLSLTKFDTMQFSYLLSKHFDVFCLIEAGLAIDKTTLK